MIRRPPRSPRFPCTTLFRSHRFLQARNHAETLALIPEAHVLFASNLRREHIRAASRLRWFHTPVAGRSEEHTSELQSRQYLVCRLLPEKKRTLSPSVFCSSQ